VELSRVMQDDMLPASAAQADTSTMVNGTSNGSTDVHLEQATPVLPQPLANGATTSKPPAARKTDTNRWVIPPFKGGSKPASAVTSANGPTHTPRAGSVSHTALSSARAVVTPIIPFERPSGTAASSGRRSGSVANIDLHSTVRTNAKKSQPGSTSPNTITAAAPIMNGKNNSVLSNGSVSAGPSAPATNPALIVPPQTNGTTVSDQHQSPSPANVQSPIQNQNMWQQATRKGHRKTKSSLAASPVSPADAATGGSGGARFQAHGRLSATTAAVSGERKGG